MIHTYMEFIQHMARGNMTLVGRKYAYITLLHFERSGGKGVGQFWKGRCDCGEVKEYLVRDVRAGRVQTCGKCSFHASLLRGRSRPKPSEHYAFRRRWAREVSQAAREGTEFHLNASEFRQITAGACSLCPVAKGLGVVRVRASEGYTPSNVTAICLTCRHHTGNMPLESLVIRWGKALGKLGLAILPIATTNKGIDTTTD